MASAIAAVMLSGLGALPVQAGPDQLALLKSYVGEWSGAGVLVGGKDPEPFRCRLTIDKGNQAKINYAGRCTLVNMNLSVSGTIGYSDTARQYEAVMISNAGFKGLAVGQQQGDNIVFDLHEKQNDRSGNAVRIGSHLTLVGATSITIDFEVEFNDSGNVLTATVPFSK
ncbi:MAG: heme-binding beta-barrel domain-containing protein [Devosia sp.]